MPSRNMNTFANALSNGANKMTGENGALRLKSSSDLRVDYFTNILQDTTTDNVNQAVDKMMAQCNSISNTRQRGIYIH